MRRRRTRERFRPMPTAEAKAQIKLAESDPLVWAARKAKEPFPDDDEIEEVVEEIVEEYDDGDEDILADIGYTERSVRREPIERPAPAPKPAAARPAAKPAAARATVSTAPATKPAAPKTAVSKPAIKKPAAKKAADKKLPGILGKIDFSQIDFKSPKTIGIIVGVVVVIAGGIFVIKKLSSRGSTQQIDEPTTQTTSVVENQSDGEYLHIKDWHMKIKIVSGLTNVSFDYDQDEYSSILVWGSRKDQGANYTPDFAKQSKNGKAMGTITRVPRYERAAAGRLIWYDDYYNYYYQGPTSDPSAAGTEEEKAWWVESYLLIKDMLTDADNYIKEDDENS